MKFLKNQTGQTNLKAGITVTFGKMKITGRGTKRLLIMWLQIMFCFLSVFNWVGSVTHSHTDLYTCDMYIFLYVYYS